jgi:hypothetical protein
MTITRREFTIRDTPIAPDVADELARLQPIIGQRLQAAMDRTFMQAVLGDPGYGQDVIDAQVIGVVPESHQLPEGTP